MRLKPEQLGRHLQQQILPLYWLAGDEPLLMQEAADLIRRTLGEQGFSERQVFHIERGFNWTPFRDAWGNLSLFAERKIVELRFTGNKPDEPARQALLQAIANPSAELVLLITSPRLDAATLKTKWFKTLEAAGALVQIWPINRQGLPQWLKQRLLHAGIQADPEALNLLLDKIEGNLLAAVQEIARLKLLANPDGAGPVQLDSRTVMQAVADSSRYNAFQLVDAALAGEVARAQKILAGLQAEGTFPLLILGSITRELRSLLSMVEKRQQGQSVSAIVQASRVWSNRKQVVGSAIARLGVDDICSMLHQARHIDQAIKGMSPANPWDELSLLLVRLAGETPATAGPFDQPYGVA